MCFLEISIFQTRCSSLQPRRVVFWLFFFMFRFCSSHNCSPTWCKGLKSCIHTLCKSYMYLLGVSAIHYNICYSSRKNILEQSCFYFMSGQLNTFLIHVNQTQKASPCDDFFFKTLQTTRQGTNSYKITLKWFGKNFRLRTQWFQLAKLTQKFKNFKQMKKKCKRIF